MQTHLTYRLPNQPIVNKVGVFKKLDSSEIFEGFMVSNFEGTEFFGFFENEINELETTRDIPVVISKSAYIDLASEFIHYIQDHSIGKAVLSRVKKVEFDDVNLNSFFLQLTEKYPKAFCYCFDSPLLGRWFGATPETLIKIEQGSGETMSLAGTKVASDVLPWGEKEQIEQQLVTDFITSELSKYCSKVNVSQRQELIAGPVKHLVHFFNFEINAQNEWELIQSLHPTPAVSGFPKNKAIQCISNFEPHDRLFYAGIIGLKSIDRTNLFVNLRCGQIIENQLYLYLGGGLTQDSIPESEWDETENKSKTILDVML